MSDRFVIASTSGYPHWAARKATTIYYVLDRPFAFAVVSQHLTRKGAERAQGRAANRARAMEWQATPKACDFCHEDYLPTSPASRFCSSACRNGNAYYKVRPGRLTAAAIAAWKRPKPDNGRFQKGAP